MIRDVSADRGSQATEIRSIYADDSNVSIGSLVRENIYSLTRDPIDTLESSAYIDLISVACAVDHNWRQGK